MPYQRAYQKGIKKIADTHIESNYEAEVVLDNTSEEGRAAFKQTKLGQLLFGDKITGHELTFQWDGGGDSGWGELYLDGKQCDTECKGLFTDAELSLLANLGSTVLESLDYGSFAGEYTTRGELRWMPDTCVFAGIDVYSEDEWQRYTAKNLGYRVPTDVFFNQLSVVVESAGDELNCELRVFNGPEQDEDLEELEVQLEKDFISLIVEDYTKVQQPEMGEQGHHWEIAAFAANYRPTREDFTRGYMVVDELTYQIEERKVTDNTVEVYLPDHFNHLNDEEEEDEDND